MHKFSHNLSNPLNFHLPLASYVKFVYIVAIMCPRRTELFNIKSSDEANTHISFIVHYINRTPSMSAKLPKMVLNRVDAIVEFWRKGRK